MSYVLMIFIAPLKANLLIGLLSLN